MFGLVLGKWMEVWWVGKVGGDGRNFYCHSLRVALNSFERKDDCLQWI